MKTICLKTEDPGKHLSLHLLDESWNVTMDEKGTSMQNLNTNENVFVLDINTNNAVLIDLEALPPEDWSPRSYYYYDSTDTWELIPPIILPELEAEPEVEPEFSLGVESPIEENNDDPIV